MSDSALDSAAAGFMLLCLALFAALLGGAWYGWSHRSGQWEFVHFTAGETSLEGAFNTSNGTLCYIGTSAGGLGSGDHGCISYPNHQGYHTDLLGSVQRTIAPTPDGTAFGDLIPPAPKR